MRILVVEDYAPVRTAVAESLRECGHAVDDTDNGQDGVWYAVNNDYDVIILDLMLPGLSGMDVLKRVQESGSQARVLMLTARDAVEDRVAGLNAGADDYLIKPFAMEELHARVDVLLRRRYNRRSSVIEVGDLKIDTSTQTVTRSGIEVPLTKREYALLVFLASRAGEVVSRSEIWDHVYDFTSDAHSNVVDVYIRYLRKKLEQKPGWTRLIHTRRGFGYILNAEKSVE